MSKFSVSYREFHAPGTLLPLCRLGRRPVTRHPPPAAGGDGRAPPGPPERLTAYASDRIIYYYRYSLQGRDPRAGPRRRIRDRRLIYRPQDASPTALTRLSRQIYNVKNTSKCTANDRTSADDLSRLSYAWEIRVGKASAKEPRADRFKFCVSRTGLEITSVTHRSYIRISLSRLVV